MNDLPIGIFDSGIGGLSVVSEIIKVLPNEDFLYLGDTARVPYGTRSKKIITLFATELTTFMIQKKIKALVVACNTISATCLDDIISLSPVPVIGVIHPSVLKIVKTTNSKRVAVIGTNATIKSNIYKLEIKKINPEIHIQQIACPLFVPIVEEGMAETETSISAAKHYLSGLDKIDTLHLACTHYPLLINTIQKILGGNVKIIDSAKPTVEELASFLKKSGLLTTRTSKGKGQYFVTDDKEKASRIGSRFVGQDISALTTLVSL